MIWLSWPLLEYRFRYRMTVDEIVKATKLNPRTGQRRMPTELDNARDFYLREGALPTRYRYLGKLFGNSQRLTIRYTSQDMQMLYAQSA